MENKHYFQTNSELAHENSSLQQQLARSSRMNSMLLAQGFEIHTKLSTISLQNNMLKEKNMGLKKRIGQIQKHAIELNRMIESIQISPIQSELKLTGGCYSLANGNSDQIAQSLKTKLVLVGKKGKEKEVKINDNLAMIKENENENCGIANQNYKGIQESFNNHKQLEREKAKRTRKNVSYKLPNLNTKLRQGDPFTDDFGS